MIGGFTQTPGGSKDIASLSNRPSELTSEISRADKATDVLAATINRLTERLTPVTRGDSSKNGECVEEETTPLTGTGLKIRQISLSVESSIRNINQIIDALEV